MPSSSHSLISARGRLVKRRGWKDAGKGKGWRREPEKAWRGGGVGVSKWERNASGGWRWAAPLPLSPASLAHDGPASRPLATQGMVVGTHGTPEPRAAWRAWER